MPEVIIHSTMSPEDRTAIVNDLVDALRPMLESRAKELVDGDELARMLSVSRPHIDRLRAAGKIPSVMVGGSRRYRPVEVIEALEDAT
ncbi:MAG: helix-turn-helix domain-containing protein [Planctomycetota bacterium]